MQTLRILHLEDSPAEAKLLRAELVAAGFDAQTVRVDTRQTYEQELKTGGYDIILADYSLPSFDGRTGLELAQQQCPDVPFIFVSGALGEEVAIELLKAGATDYVLKQRLERLGPAVRRALREAEDRRVLRDAENALLRSQQRAEAANRAKDDFLAVLSHELRTPLTPVLLTASILAADPNFPLEYRDDLLMIRRNVELEARLIDDLLDLTRISRGKLEMSMQEIDLREILRRAIEICSRDVTAKNLKLSTQLHATRNCVNGDPARLQQILWNLLTNAIKFTPPGGAITIRLENAADHPDLIQIRITDSGVGISRNVLARVFDAFEQGGSSVTREFGGLGLGLAISKRLVQMHNGSIRAESDGEGRGATFVVELQTIAPTTKTQSHFEPSQSKNEPFESSGRLHILLVEDNADTAAAMARLLGMTGYSTRVATTVKHAVQLAEMEGFDLIITDLGLPDGSGLDLLTHIGQKVPAIVLSGYGMEADLQRSKAAGFSEHLTKPVSFDHLKKVIERVIAQTDRSVLAG